MRYILTTLFFILMFLTFAKAPLPAAEVVDKIVAVVNDEVITKSEVEQSLHPFIADYRLRYGEEKLADKIDAAKQDALNRLIEERLLLQHAIEKDIKVEDAEIEERVDEVKKKFRTDEDFIRTLKESGMSLAKLRSRYKEQLMMKKLVTGLISAKVNVSPSQVAAYYYGNRDDFTEPEMVRFKVIMLKYSPERDKEAARKLALEILGRIESGESFDALAKEYSDGPNVDKGGDMGYMQAGTILKDLEDALLQLNLGETSPLIETQSGFNIVELVDRKPARIKDIEEVKGYIKERLFQREAELVLREFLNKLKENAYIKIQ